MTVDEQIDEVLRLDEAATKGPWIGLWDQGYGERSDRCSVSVERRDDALIVRYRSLAPELARELRRMREMVRSMVAKAGAATALSFWTYDTSEESFAEAWTETAAEMCLEVAGIVDEMALVYRAAFEAEMAKMRGCAKCDQS